ncbi:MAG: hypothetical protein OXF02_00710, partial [Simkaniaceae bacterium]|nr:hypothetical protein [Simkaniaceae bacterium]
MSEKIQTTTTRDQIYDPIAQNPTGSPVTRIACRVADIKPLFAVVHADFMGNSFAVPGVRKTITHILEFARAMKRTGKEPKISDKSLCTLEKHLANILHANRLIDTYKNNYREFSKKLLQLLREEGTVVVPSGYRTQLGGHMIFILFRMDREMVSADIFNRGEGAERVTDRHGRVRVLPKQPLYQVSVDTLREHRFWHIFLALHEPEREDGKPADLTIADFYDTLLPEWPGGRGDPYGKPVKPQYGGTCTFAGIKTVIRDLIPEEEVKPFLLTLSAHLLREYARSPDVNLSVLKDAGAHLARRMIRYGKHHKNDPLFIKEVRLSVEEAETVTKREQAREKRKVPFPLSQPIRESEPGELRCLLPTQMWQHTVEEIEMPEDFYEKLEYTRSLTFITLPYKDKVCLLRDIVLALPPINDPVRDNDDMARRIFTLLRGVRDALIRRMPISLDPDDFALAFVADMMCLKYALSFQKDRHPDIPLPDFYVARIREVFHSPAFDLIRPLSPDVATRFTEAADYLCSFKEYEHPTGVKWGSFTMSIHLRSMYEKQLTQKAPHIAYLREIMSLNTNARKRFLSWYGGRRHRKPGECDEGTGTVAGILWAWRLLGTETFEEHLLADEVPQFADLGKLDTLWSAFFITFATEKETTQSASMDKTGKAFGGTITFEESCNKDRWDGGMNLLLTTYPGLQSGYSVNRLRWLLSRRVPERITFVTEVPGELRASFLPAWEKAGENAHLLCTQRLQTCESVLSREEIRGLLACTEEKELAIDTIISHFKRFPHSLQNVESRTALSALLTQTYHMRKQKGENGTRPHQRIESKTRHLLLWATQHSPGQLLRLTTFAREMENKAEEYDLVDQLPFLLFVEGVALAYFLRSEGREREKENAYSSFVRKAKHLLCSDEHITCRTGSTLLMLVPYFANTSKQTEYGSLVKEEVKKCMLPNSPQEELRFLHGYRHIFPTQPMIVPATNEEVLIDPPRFPGIYRKKRLTKTSWSCTYSPIALAQDLDCYALQSESVVCYLFFRHGKKQPVCFYDGVHIERLQDGRRTGTFLVKNGCSHLTRGGRFFAKIACPDDLFLWKNTEGRVVVAEYGRWHFSFQFDGKRWMSTKHPGFFLDPEVLCPLFEPATHYLLLRNEEGKRIVYMTNGHLNSLKYPPELFDTPPVEVEKTQYQTLFFYFLDEKGNIDTSAIGPVELFYAAHLALRAGHFTKASRLIDALKRNSQPMNSDHLPHCLYAVVYVPSGLRDKHPKGVALRIRLLLFVVENPDICGRSTWSREACLQALQNELRNYLWQADNVFPFALTAEEKALAQRVVPVAFREPERMSAPYETMRLWRRFHPSERFGFTPCRNLPIPHVLRPVSLVSHFLDYYTIARDTPEEDPARKNLSFVIHASKHECLCDVMEARMILRAVLQEPDRFPSVYSLSKGKRELLAEIWKTIFAENADEEPVSPEGPHPTSVVPYHPDDDPDNPFLTPLPFPFLHAKRSPSSSPKKESGTPLLTESIPRGVTTTSRDVREEIEIVSAIRNALEARLLKGKPEPCVRKEAGALIEG